MKKTVIGICHLIAVILLSTGCENDIEKINLLNTSSEYPNVVGEDVELLYSDSAKVKVHMFARELKQYSNAEKPFSEFPRGIQVIFYDDSLQMESEIRANRAVYYNDEKLWHATGNVTVQNFKSGERLDSEELYWDEEREQVYSNAYTRIVNENGIFHGQEGFRSNQALTDYELIGSRAVINIKEDE